MIRGRTPGATCTFTPCSRGGSGAANTRRGPSCLRKQNWRTNSAAGATPPPGRSGHSNATGWPGGFSKEGTYRQGRMLIQASHDAPSRFCPQATSAPPPFVSPTLPPYSRVDKDGQQDVGSRTSAHAAPSAVATGTDKASRLPAMPCPELSGGCGFARRPVQMQQPRRGPHWPCRP